MLYLCSAVNLVKEMASKLVILSREGLSRGGRGSEAGGRGFN